MALALAAVAQRENRDEVTPDNLYQVGTIVRIAQVQRVLLDGATQESIDCAVLGVSGGWSPAIHLASQAGQNPVWDDGLQAFLPPQPTQAW